MKTLIQRCDFCGKKESDELGLGYVETKRVFKLGNKEACHSCHYKAQMLLEVNLDIKNK